MVVVVVLDQSKEEIETLENEGLTDKQRLFCLYYSKSFNAIRAYQKAYKKQLYNCFNKWLCTLGNARVKNEIIDRKAIRACG